MTLCTRLRRLRRDASGTVLVEFTLVAPLLIALMCGLAEFGLVLRQYAVMTKGVGDATRYLARAPANPPCTGVADANWTTAVTEAKNLAIYGVTSGGTALFKGWTNPATIVVTDTCLANPRVMGSALPQITTTATAPYADLGMLSVIGLGPITLTVTHQELKVS